MTKLIIINGTMGAGKTVTAKALYKSLEASVWLDGDWCWMMNPFDANEENKEMVIENITYLLNNFIKNSNIKYIVFNWVIHLEEIFDMILSKLQGEIEVEKITLMVDKSELKKRFEGDANRKIEDYKGSSNRLELYEAMDTKKINTSSLKVEGVVEKIIDYLSLEVNENI